ncbi:MAG: sulfite exporter TauE/SafE family protein [Candidatus Thorarchaeota archaeon]
MDYMQFLLLTGIVGLVSGFASGFFGIGGGSVRIPLLNLIGFSLITAYGMNLMALPVTTLMGAVSHREHIDFHLGKYMILGGTLGTVVGTLIAFHLAYSSLMLAIVFVIVSILSVLALNFSTLAPDTSQHLQPTFHALTSSIFASNVLTGMRGGSEGSLFVPILRLFNVDMRRAIATALFAAVFTSLVGVFLYWSQSYLLVVEGLVVLLGSTIGARFGSFFSLKTKPRWLEHGLSILIIILAIATLLKAMMP